MMLCAFVLQVNGLVVDMEDYGSKLENFDTNDDIQSKVVKVEVGDNFAIIAGELENGNLFFVVLCDKALHCCEAMFEDGWGNKWYEGNMLLGGIWPCQRGPTLLISC